MQGIVSMPWHTCRDDRSWRSSRLLGGDTITHHKLIDHKPQTDHICANALGYGFRNPSGKHVKREKKLDHNTTAANNATYVWGWGPYGASTLISVRCLCLRTKICAARNRHGTHYCAIRLVEWVKRERQREKNCIKQTVVLQTLDCRAGGYSLNC